MSLSNISQTNLGTLAARDVLLGTAGDDLLIARGGNDTVRGLQGADTLRGGGDNDVLSGGKGDDRLFSGGDNAKLLGGDGYDRVRIADGHDSAKVSAGVGMDRIHTDGNLGRLHGDGGHDRITVGELGELNKVYGDGGEDRISILGGRRNIADGGLGDDRIEVDGGNRNVAYGRAGDDWISLNSLNGEAHGGAGNDRIFGAEDGRKSVLDGGIGSDKITVHLGQQVIQAGLDEDADTIVFTGAMSVKEDRFDTVEQFDTANDKFDLSDVTGPVAGGPETPELHFSGTEAEANGVWYEVEGEDARVLADWDGDGEADFNFLVTNVTELSEKQFIFT